MAVGGIALLLLLGALGFQYLDSIAPCEMCHWQRWAHMGAVLAGLCGGGLIAAGTLNGRTARALALLAIGFVILSGLIGAYQAGMQWHILPGPAACTAPRYIVGSGAPAPVIYCNVVQFSLFGLSLAAYNALISFAVALLALLALRRAA
jgi:disulfide bond formation protein DsbB